MIKALTFIALIGYAATTTIEIPDKAWKSLKPSKVPQMYGPHRLGSQASYADFSECPSLHKYDVAAGTADPNPPEVPGLVTLNLDVIFNDDVNVEGISVGVLVTILGSDTPVNLASFEYNAKTPGPYYAGDEFEQEFTWPIPSFAPLGHYTIQVKLHGPDQTKDNYACIQADFDISQ